MDRLFSALRATLPTPDQIRAEFAGTEGSPEEITRRALGWLPQGAENIVAHMPVPGGGGTIGGALQAADVGGRAVNALNRETLRPAIGAAVAAGTAGENLIAGLRGGPQQELPELTRLAMEAHGREKFKQNLPAGEFLFETLGDVTTYIPFGKAAQGAQLAGKALQARGPGLTLVGAGLEGLGRATGGWNTLMERAGPELLKGVGKGLMEAPVIGGAATKLFEPSALSKAAKETGALGQAALAAMRTGEGALQTMREAMRPGVVKTARGKAVWRQTGEELSGFEDDLLGLQGPERQAVGLQIYAELQARKNALERETSRRISSAKQAMGLPAGHAELITEEEGAALISQAWRDQANGTVAVARAGREALDNLAGMAMPKSQMALSDRKAVQASVEEAVRTIRNSAGEARDMAAKLKGTGTFAGEGVFEGAPMADEIEPLLAAEDEIYQSARAAIHSALDTTVERVAGAMSGKTDQMADDLMQEGLRFYRTRAGDLTELGKPLHERAIGASADQRALLEKHAVPLNASFRAVEADDEYVRAAATPLLRDWVRRGNPTLTADALAVKTDEVMANGDLLRRTLADMERSGALAAQTRKKIVDRLDKYAGVGDLLDDTHWFNLSLDNFGRREAIAQGEKPPSAMLGAYFAATGVWRDTALLSPRFTLNNMIWMLWSAQREGYNAAPIAASYMKNMANVAKQVLAADRIGAMPGAGDLVRAVVDEPHIIIETSTATAPHLAALGMQDMKGNLQADYRIAQQTASGVSTMGPGQGRSALSRKNLQTGLVGATLTGGVGYAAPADTEEERLKRAAIGAGIGGAAGAALPTLVWANRLLSQVVERGGRLEIYSQAVDRAMTGRVPALKEAGIGADGLLKYIRVHDTATQEMIARRMTRRGQPVEGIAGMMGSQWTSPMGPAATPAPPAFGPGLGQAISPPPVPPAGQAFGPAPPTAGQYAGQVGPDGITVEMGEGPRVLERKATPEMMAKLEEWVSAQGAFFSPQGLREAAVREGFPVELADDYADEWARHIQVAGDHGVAESNAINFDYGDVSYLTEKARKSGVFPFATFTIKALPNVTTWMIQDPRLFIAMDRLNNLSDDDIAEAGLSPKFARLAKMGVLGEWMSGLLLGRTDAELLAQPWSMFVPYAEVGRPPRPAPGETGQQPLERVLDAAGQFGASLGPVPQLVGRLTGWTPDLGGSLLRTSPYVEAATTFAGQGAGLEQAAINPEAPLQGLIRGVRTAITGERTPTVTGDALKDYAVRQRIAEVALQKTGRPPTGDYKAAMDDPKSAIWRQAQREVERQRAGQTVAAASIPFRTRALTDMEMVAADAQKREKLTPADLNALTPEARKKTVSAAYARGSKGVGLWGLGSRPEQIGNRQYDAYLKESKKWKRLTPERRNQKKSAYLEDKPYLREKLASFV